ncbi:MD-2-related lipid-recognition protein [Papilio machaon]|uniref:MD-2-related lipid-recognition protein n=1 Tax=Papilio machaon TaxID=76193 RepID=A0A194RI95_PAPMA|nr:MD-2-related lipid-recognition protein [Papilio machaon]KPJ17282.1 MD-2-related lipid-recognition protein [Papilio machaon]
MDVRIIILSLCFLFVQSDFVIKKNCKDVDTSQCSIHNVAVDPCPRGPRLCVVKPDKAYSVNVDFTPHFPANNIKLALYSDDKKTNTYDTVIKTPEEVCGLVNCPLEAEERKNFDVHFTLGKMLPGKFPIKMVLWNEENKSQQCCFTFNVKIRK